MSILKTYTCDGTPAAAATVANTGFVAISGTLVFNSTGTALEVASGGTAYGEDQTAGDYCAIWFSVPAIPTGTDECIAEAMNGTTALAAVRVRSTGAISIYSGLGTLVATTTAAITPGTEYRLEWNTRTDGQELRLYTAHGATAIETLTGAVASALATTKRRIGHPQTAQSAGVLDVYQVTINDAWPNASNAVPIANAGSDQTGIAAGSVVILDGTASSDPDSDPITYSWTQTAGTAVTLSSATAAQPTFTAPSTSSAQTLTFSLVVSDNQGGTSTPDTVNIGVLATNRAPIANAGVDQTGISAGVTITLDGSGSSDPDGDTITYAWTQTAGTTVTLSSTTVAKPTFTAPSTSSAQTLTFSLVVTDSHGAASTADTVNIGVLAVVSGGTILQSYTCDGTAGTAVTAANTGFAIISGSMVFNATGTAIEVADSITAYAEDQTVGDYSAIWFSVPALPTTTDDCIMVAMNGTTTLAAVRIQAAGTLSIYSGLGTLVATTTSTITPGTRYRLEWNTRTDGQELRLYTLHGSTAIESLTGAVSSALSTTKRRFGHPQTAQSSGIIDIFQVTINSGWPNAYNTAPVANAGADQSNIAAGTTVTLNGSSSVDQDGDTITYAWTQTAGTTVTLSSTTVANPTFTVPSSVSAQTLTFSLIVTDSNGLASVPDTVNIGILSTNHAPTANAGTDQTSIAAGSTVTLNGSGSSDPDTGDTLTYAWSQVSGTVVTLSNANIANPTFTAPVASSPQTLVFSLIVTDNHGTASSADTVSIGILAHTNLRIRIAGSFVPAVEKVRIGGTWVAITGTVNTGGSGGGGTDSSTYSDTYSDSY